MPKVRVIGIVDPDILSALLQLLSEAGLEVLEGDPRWDAEAECGSLDATENDTNVSAENSQDDIDALESPLPLCEEDAGIVILSPGCMDDGTIDVAMRQAAARGCHVIGIWPPGVSEGDLPQSFEDYGGDTTIWDPSRLREVVSRSDTNPSWSLPDDRPRPERAVRRHKC